MTHYINGKWLSSNGPKFQASNPATNQIIWEGHAADTQTVQAAIESARVALSLWQNLHFKERQNYLESFAKVLEKHQLELAEAISKNTGKPLWESLLEVDSMKNKIKISIEAYHQRCPEIHKIQGQSQNKTTHRAHGVMAVLGPFNFPGHLPNGHIIPALLAGNTIVFKPSELTPLVAELTLKCWEETGIPPGVINLIQGGKDTGQALIKHPLIDGLLFTGSWSTGKFLAETFAKTPDKILALEMGGNNPLVIGKLRDYQTAAYLTLQSAYLTSGQRCTCARRLIVPKGNQGEEFLEHLVAMISKIRIGSYKEFPEPFMGPVISASVAKYLLGVQEKLIQQGAQPIVSLTSSQPNSAFLTPGLLDVTKINHRPDEEYFGPLLQLIRVENFQEALTEANHTNFGLAAGLLSHDENEYRQFFQSAKAGIINWNVPLTGASSSAPFGGIRQSGNQRPSAFYAADYCAYPIASMLSEDLKMPSNLTPGIAL